MRLPAWATTVTSWTKGLAMVLFALLPAVGFWLGQNYQKSITPLVTATGSQSVSNNHTSTIHPGGNLVDGTITISPSQPVCRSEESCTKPGANLTIQAKDQSGQIVATTVSDGNGHYLFDLGPGKYLVVVAGAVIRQPQNNVTLTGTGSTVHLNFTIDTGIR